ncbi:hypothetical protein HJG60_008057 [Phyllostomus discolor]|uniref:Uncharacterized protein n=1 Tax=Phyllostomus discolor TaxID=89673 RepID=A0A834BDN7_9CHIR|nr:hypothetical protein HJG60_008057 [Phyllostomus discolor]
MSMHSQFCSIPARNNQLYDGEDTCCVGCHHIHNVSVHFCCVHSYIGDFSVASGNPQLLSITMASFNQIITLGMILGENKNIPLFPSEIAFIETVQPPKGPACEIRHFITETKSLATKRNCLLNCYL